MFKTDDEKYLKRLIFNNQVVLFLGSGFSRDSKNKLGENFPTGYKLGEKIWKFLNYVGDYDGTSLPEMYQALLSSGLKQNIIEKFLETNLLCSSVPQEYNIITKPFWYKIYTINIDDVITTIYNSENKKIKELISPKDEFFERDQSLESIQVVYLHGKLPCNPNDVIFSNQQYAKSNLKNQPLYGQFVYDYATLPTVFIGTDLNEPLFNSYIEAREGKNGFRELRPKSFLIIPELSPVKADNLRNNYNVHHISGTALDFINWLKKIESEIPTRIDVLRKTFPSLLKLYEYSDVTGTSNASLNEFAKSFNRIPEAKITSTTRSSFLLGASPRWQDIFKELDIPRTINKSLFDIIGEIYEDNNLKSKTSVISIIGYAGSGKSTIIKRLGYQLSQQGRTAFLSYSDFMPRIDHIIKVLTTIEERVIIFFDNSKNILSQLPNLIKELNTQLKNPPIIVLGLRTNFLDNLNYFLDDDTSNNHQFNIPNLDDNEIKLLINKLDENNLLGILKGKNSYDREREFKYKANRQILIAMKEATSGRSFGEIIESEFNSIEPYEAKIICVCIALNTELGFTNSKQDLVGFSKVSHIEALNYLETVLQGTITWVGSNNERFMLRHKILADYIIQKCASTEILKEAYIRVLSILAPELKKSQGPSRKFNLYKSLINHQVLYRRFQESIELARDVYDSIATFFDEDANFWLQYGSLEIEGVGGNLTLAENYLNQADSLAPNYDYILNAKCNLYYKMATTTNNFVEALEYKNIADDLAHQLILKVGKDEPHIYHIHCRGRYNFITKWIVESEKKKEELKNLKKTITTAIKFHPRDKRLDVAFQAINRAYLYLGIEDDIEDPEIPNY